MDNFKAFNFALIYYNKYGFVGAFKEYKRQLKPSIFNSLLISFTTLDFPHGIACNNYTI